jgi:hypothetical protein
MSYAVGAGEEGVVVAELKTVRTEASVDDFLAGVADQRRRTDAQAVCALMTEVTGERPAMWGDSIVGFGTYHYRNRSGQQADWPAVGLSPRKTSLTVYLSAGFEGITDLLERLGPHSLGKSCLYIKRLSDIDQDVLRSLITSAYRDLNGRTIET